MTATPVLNATQERKRMPPWLRREIGPVGKKTIVENKLEAYNLHTVCTEARCPNKMECFSHGTATLLILGKTCTRACAFCGVTKGNVAEIDQDEPQRVAAAVKALGLHYVVITSVTRDDLPDGGAGIFAKTVGHIRAVSPECGVEVLVPDFKGDPGAIRMVCESRPAVFAHNLETVARLYPVIRPQADFLRSLSVLKQAAELVPEVKAGLMVGLGEQPEEIIAAMRAVIKTGCARLTIGQYLQPSARQVGVSRFCTPQEFEEYKTTGISMGFKSVVSGAFVRSSYHAQEAFTCSQLHQGG
jgi:lipoyl synthase